MKPATSLIFLGGNIVEQFEEDFHKVNINI